MTDSIQVSQAVSQEPERVWTALTDPTHLANWQADVAELTSERGLHLGWPALGVETELEILEQDRGRRLVLAGGRSRVTFKLSPGALALEHAGLSGQDELEGVRSSWQVALALLNHYLDHHFGHPRKVHWTIAAAETSAATAHVFYSDPSALDAWLTQNASGFGLAGSQCQMKFTWGEALSGSVLAKTAERDVAVTWSERDNSVLVFRTLPAPFRPGQRILALCWSHWNCSDNHESTQQGFEGALATLKKLLATRGSA